MFLVSGISKISMFDKLRRIAYPDNEVRRMLGYNMAYGAYLSVANNDGSGPQRYYRYDCNIIIDPVIAIYITIGQSHPISL